MVHPVINSTLKSKKKNTWDCPTERQVQSHELLIFEDPKSKLNQYAARNRGNNGAKEVIRTELEVCRGEVHGLKQLL